MALPRVSVEVPGGGLHLVSALQLDLPAAGSGEDFEPVTEAGESTRAEGWRMAPGEHLMVTGSNGVGKTAIAHVIAGLWPGVGGRMERPERSAGGVFVVPQRAYMVVGSLLDQ